MGLKTKKDFEAFLNEIYGYGMHNIRGSIYTGYYGTLLRRHDPIAFDEERWNHSR